MPNVIIHGDNGVTFPDGTVQGTGLTTGAQVIAGAKTFSSTPTFATLTATLGAAGSVMLPGGLIVKWGTTGSIASGSNETVTFPTPFPTAVYNIQTTPSLGANLTGTLDTGAQILSTSQMRAYVFGGTIALFWFAIGS